MDNVLDADLSGQEGRVIELEEALEAFDHLKEELELSLIKACKVIAHWVNDVVFTINLFILL